MKTEIDYSSESDADLREQIMDPDVMPWYKQQMLDELIERAYRLGYRDGYSCIERVE